MGRAIAIANIVSIVFAGIVLIEFDESFGAGPRIVTRDIYMESKVPVAVSFDVYGHDSDGNKIKVECDRVSGAVFKVGKSTVRCIAYDDQGNESRASFVVTVGYNIVEIPHWLKKTTLFWIEQKITDKEYLDTLHYLLDKKIMFIPHSKHQIEPTTKEIPVWIKDISKKWANDNLSDDEVSIGIQWMIERGLIDV